MADEAVVRIILDDEGGPASAQAPSAPVAPVPPQQPSPPPRPVPVPVNLKGEGISSPPLLPAAAGQIPQVDQTYLASPTVWPGASEPNLKAPLPPPSTVPPPPGDDDFEERRRRRLADSEERTRQQQEESKANEEAMRAYVEAINKATEEENRRFDELKANEEALKASTEAARKATDSAATPRALVDIEYEKIKPPGEEKDDKKKKKRSDAAFEVVDALRGTLGGVFGPVAGASLDLVKGFKKANEETDGFTRGLIKTSVAVGAATVAFQAVTGALDEAVDRYGEVNAQVAQAQGVAEARIARADIERGSRYGEDLAKYIKSRTDIQITFEEAKMKILTRLAPLVETVFGVVSGIPGLLENLPTLIATAIAVRSGNPLAAGAAAILEISQLIHEWTRRDQKDDIQDPADGMIPLYEGDPGRATPRVGD